VTRASRQEWGEWVEECHKMKLMGMGEARGRVRIRVAGGMVGSWAVVGIQPGLLCLALPWLPVSYSISPVPVALPDGSSVVRRYLLMKKAGLSLEDWPCLKSRYSYCHFLLLLRCCLYRK
jgi:hypothetical protein